MLELLRRGWLLLAFAILCVSQGASCAELLFEKDCNAQAASVVVLIDVTTSYDDVDRSILRDSALTIFDKLANGERLSILTIEDSFAHSRPLIEACIPYCPEGSVLDELLSDCTAGVLLKKRRELAARLRDVLVSLLNSSSDLNRSDIVRTIYYDLHGIAGDDSARPMNLYVFSDMLENSSLISFGEFFRVKVAALIDKVRRNNLIQPIPGATVRIFGVGRNHLPGRPDLSVAEMGKVTEFWRALFEAAGAATIDITPRLEY